MEIGSLNRIWKCILDNQNISIMNKRYDQEILILYEKNLNDIEIPKSCGNI
jgi:hypothetical protein